MDYVNLGTRELISEAHSQARRELSEAFKEFEIEVDTTFERLENDAVDEFLDWYYSLGGEWVRLFKLAGGTERLEDYLAEKVRETFEQEKWYADINVAFERLLSSDKKGTYCVRAEGARNTRPKSTGLASRRSRHHANRVA